MKTIVILVGIFAVVAVAHAYPQPVSGVYNYSANKFYLPAFEEVCTIV